MFVLSGGSCPLASVNLSHSGPTAPASDWFLFLPASLPLFTWHIQCGALKGLLFTSIPVMSFLFHAIFPIVENWENSPLFCAVFACCCRSSRTRCPSALCLAFHAPCPHARCLPSFAVPRVCTPCPPCSTCMQVLFACCTLLSPDYLCVILSCLFT